MQLLRRALLIVPLTGCGPDQPAIEAGHAGPSSDGNDTSAGPGTSDGSSASAGTGDGGSTSTGPGTGDGGSTSAGPGTGPDLGTIDLDEAEADPCASVMFADPEIESVVRASLGVAEGPITAEMAQSLTMLMVVNFVSELGGVECLSQLRRIDLDWQGVDDITPLTELMELERATLAAGAIHDVTPLAGHTKLRELNLSSNPIASLAPLAGLPLVTLWIDGAPGAVPGVSALLELQHLRVGDCDLTDIEPLAPLASLKTLMIADNAIVDLGPLAGKTELAELDAGYNAIVSLAPLAGLPLQQLQVNDNEIVDLGPLATLLALEHLNASANPLALGLDSLADHPSLRSISLSYTGLQALPVVAPKTLETLRATHNHISDLGPLQGYQALNTLDLDRNAITTLAPLVGAPWLGYDDNIFVADNPLDSETIEVIIPALCAAGVSVQWGVSWDNLCNCNCV